MGASAANASNTKSNVACAAGHIQHFEGAVIAGRVELCEEVVLPQAVKTARHQIIHLVITGGGFGKDLIDEALFFAFFHVAEAEFGFYA